MDSIVYCGWSISSQTIMLTTDNGLYIFLPVVGLSSHYHFGRLIPENRTIITSSTSAGPPSSFAGFVVDSYLVE